jgi:hypothetical protein
MPSNGRSLEEEEEEAEEEERVSALYIPFFFQVSWGGVRLSPLGTSATNWLIVPASDDR